MATQKTSAYYKNGLLIHGSQFEEKPSSCSAKKSDKEAASGGTK